MDEITVDEIDPISIGDGLDRRELSDPLGTTDVAIQHDRIAPGTGFPGGSHAHVDQEEAFLVVDGEATFETLDGEIEVGSGGAIRVARGAFQSG